MKTLIILNFVTRELWKFNFNKENFGKENFNKENFGKVLNFAEVEKFQTLPKLKKLKKFQTLPKLKKLRKVLNFAEVEDIHSFIRSIKKLSRISIFISFGEAHLF